MDLFGRAGAAHKKGSQNGYCQENVDISGTRRCINAVVDLAFDLSLVGLGYDYMYV